MIAEILFPAIGHMKSAIRYIASKLILLNDPDPACCKSCGHLLIGRSLANTSKRCPECGTSIAHTIPYEIQTTVPTFPKLILAASRLQLVSAVICWSLIFFRLF